MSPYKLVRKAYAEVYTDAYLVTIMMSIIGDIVDNNPKFPDDSPMGLYTVGDVRATRGFYADVAMLSELTNGMIGRALRGIFMMFCGGLPPADRRMLDFLHETDAQCIRVVPLILTKAVAKYGQPAIIDHDKIADLSTRAHRALHGLDG